MYKSDMAWSSGFIPQVKSEVGRVILSDATTKQDCEEATDLVILCAADKTIAVRIRREQAKLKYPGQATLRCLRRTGAKTELAKVIDGFGDLFFYGYGAADGRNLLGHIILSLNALRSRFAKFPALLSPVYKVSDDLHGTCSSRGVPHTNRYAGITGCSANGDGTYFWWMDVQAVDRLDPFNPMVVSQSDFLPSSLNAAQPCAVARTGVASRHNASRA